MPDRLRILRVALLVTGGSIGVIVAARAIAAQPIPTFWLVRAAPFIFLASLVLAVPLTRLFRPIPPDGAPGRLTPALAPMPFDEARKRADRILAEVGVQRALGRAPDDLDALGLAHESIAQFARDWGSLRSRALALDIDLAPVAERLRASEAPRPGEPRIEIGALDGAALLLDVRDGSVAIVRPGGADPHPLVPSLHHAIVFAGVVPEGHPPRG